MSRTPRQSTIADSTDSTAGTSSTSAGTSSTSAGTSSTSAADSQTFENALAELERLVAQMEGGDLSLEQSLAAHKRGFALARLCQQRLESAQQQVRVLEGDVLKTLSAALVPDPAPDASDD